MVRLASEGPGLASHGRVEAREMFSLLGMGNLKILPSPIATVILMQRSPVPTVNSARDTSPPVQWSSPTEMVGPGSASTPRMAPIAYPLVPGGGGPPPVMWGRMVLLAVVGTIVLLLVLSALRLIQFGTWLPLRWFERVLMRMLSSDQGDQGAPPPAPRPPLLYPLLPPAQRFSSAAAPSVPGTGNTVATATASAVVPVRASTSTTAEPIAKSAVPVTGRAETEHRLTSKLEEAVQIALQGMFGVGFSKIRPTWLRNPASGRALELDLAGEVPVSATERRLIAFEIDEVHHFCFPNGRHKSIEEFELQKYRDAIKTSMCREHNVVLIRVPFTVARKDVEAFLHQELRKAGVHLPSVSPSAWPAAPSAAAAASLQRRDAPIPHSIAGAPSTGPGSGR